MFIYMFSNTDWANGQTFQPPNQAPGTQRGLGSPCCPPRPPRWAWKQPRMQCEQTDKEAGTEKSQGTKGGRGQLPARGGMSGKKTRQLDVLTALLSYSLHNIKLTPFKYSLMRFSKSMHRGNCPWKMVLEYCHLSHSFTINPPSHSWA